ncbi:SusC/RagA family TonB-linked outer membrane protein [Chitinophaga oryziterrae]|uniref:SusC/RagA family TonB-linked outer membrane protein n=1 Tax=Chitinophaga oryziterrae TaxID=1031224 RepID=A0A6N8JGS9_9BACT|nr:TonB-dependent receptor [Chitinophaga oryziterrae]MVT44505.1 SusC/RagA family TonB-linked outer membrane protein [Chitinophaga oryziterrae]
MYKHLICSPLWRRFSIQCSLLLLLCCFQAIAQQKMTITGAVSDSAEGPLAGVVVQVVGKSVGTQTNAGGQYTLQAAPGDVLSFRFLGYDEKRVTVGTASAINIRLQSSTSGLNEVVVIGYGSQQKKDMTGAITSINARQLQDLPTAGLDQKLAGQVPGVQVGAVSGTPGGGASIKIRGSGSIGAGSDPLYVVDGFPLSGSFDQQASPLNVINPDDIETMTVLKDASSTAIYGSRGANGVVVITTKHGQKGAPRITLNTYTGFQQVPDKGKPKMLNAREFAQFRKDIIADDFASRGLTATDADIPADYRHPEQYGEGTNWYNTVLHTAPQHNTSLGVSGGSDNTKYNFSFGYFDQDGVLRYTDYKRYTVRANIESKIGRKVKIGIDLAPTYSQQHVNDFENGFTDVLTRSLWLSPLIPVTDSTGKRTPYIASNGMFSAANPLNSLQYGATKVTGFSGLGGVYGEYEIIDGLKFRGSFNVNYGNGSSFVFNPSILGGVNNPPPSVPNSSQTKTNRLNWLSEMLLTYDKKLGKDHALNVVLGYTAQKERMDFLQIDATNYPDDLIQPINAAATIPTYNQDVQEWAILSYLGRINYSYKGKYLLTGTVRSDGSSRFGTNNRFGTFPSGAFAWRASEEEFLKHVSWLSDLKLRVSYGLSGNYNIGNYTYVSNINSTNYVFGGGVASGRSSSNLRNPDLTWEESSQLDAGIDAGFFGGRLNVTADYYRRITRGMLYNSEIPLSSGYSNVIINSGKIENHGFEFGINTDNLSGDLKWTTNANIAFNRNKVLALNDKNDPIYSGRSGEGSYTHITEVGKPIGLFYGYKVLGVYKDQADFDKSPRNVTSVVGSIKYKDVDGNGVIEPVNDFEIIGDPTPKFIWGLTNHFNYKSFDLGVVLVGSQGGQIMKTSKQYLQNIDGIFNVDRSVLNRWRSPEHPGDGQTPTTNGARVIYRDVNSSWIESGSFMRIQNIALGYNFAKRLLEHTKFISTARLYASVQNLATFTKYSGANPEVSRKSPSGNASNVGLTPGEDFTNYPLARTYTLGINLSF